MKKLSNASIDVGVTSPPYNIGIDYNTYVDTQERNDYIEWSLNWTDEMFRILKPDGSFFLNVGSCPANPFLPHELILRLRSKWKLQNTFHWIKSITIDGNPPVSKGHFKPLNSKRFVNDCHEFVFHLTKSGCVPIDRLAVGVPYADQSNVKRWAHTEGKNLRCRGNTWFIPYDLKTKDAAALRQARLHPAAFPVKLVEMCLKIHGAVPASLTVIDPFLGTGTSGVASKKVGVAHFIGYDIDAKYIDYATNRCHEA